MASKSAIRARGKPPTVNPYFACSDMLDNLFKLLEIWPDRVNRSTLGQILSMEYDSCGYLLQVSLDFWAAILLTKCSKWGMK